ncbi:MAG: DUF2971 domain-containing protein [Acidobacteriia bacterium]|nr:DUF2971 domain-containing protein [Terriglobia bacterium]
MNDTREFRHATELARQELERIVAAWSGPQSTFSFPGAREYMASMQGALSAGIEPKNICVCSFSEKGDVLSQWRAYGGGASGFAIGFSGEHLREMVKDRGWLVPVLYNESEQRALVRTLLEDLINEQRDRSEEEKAKLPLYGNLLEYLNRYAPILKHQSFGEECEWRIVTRPIDYKDEHFGYRAGPSMLIPYFRLSLRKTESLGIREIVIGPTPHPEQSRGSALGLLIKSGLAGGLIGAQLKFSAIPYRNW